MSKVRALNLKTKPKPNKMCRSYPYGTVFTPDNRAMRPPGGWKFQFGTLERKDPPVYDVWLVRE